MDVQMQSKINANHLLADIAVMPVSELEYFVSEVNALIIRKKTDDINNREKILLGKISKTGLNLKLRERYKVLAEKLENDTLTDTEHTEFMILTTKDETLRNERVKYLIELAQLRGVSLAQVMKNLGLIRSNTHG